MKKGIVVLTLLALILSSVGLSGCASPTKIGDITASPAQFEGKEVTIKGTAGNSFWLAILAKGAYEIADSTGSIWVVCSTSPPNKNTIIKIQGTVEKAMTIGDRSLGTVIIEKKRENL